MCMGVFYMCMHVHIYVWCILYIYITCVLEEVRRMCQDLLELELHMAVSHHVDAWNQTHPGSPEEQLLTIEASLQPCGSNFL